MEPVYRTVVGMILSVFRTMDWDVRVTGLEHVPETGGAVIATNHIGYLDFTFVGAAVREATRGRRLVRFAAKKAAFDHPLSGPLMRAMKHVPVDRAGDPTAAIDHAIRLARAGELVGMFPEATISRSFVPLPGKTGTARIAREAGVPIVPGAVWGSQRIYTKGRPRALTRRHVPITVDFGPPLAVPPDADVRTATGELMAAITDLASRAAAAYPDRPGRDEDPWWVPAHLGGTAPSPEDALRIREEEAAQRRAALEG